MSGWCTTCTVVVTYSGTGWGIRANRPGDCVSPGTKLRRRRCPLTRRKGLLEAVVSVLGDAVFMALPGLMRVERLSGPAGRRNFVKSAARAAAQWVAAEVLSLRTTSGS